MEKDYAPNLRTGLLGIVPYHDNHSLPSNVNARSVDEYVRVIR